MRNILRKIIPYFLCASLCLSAAPNIALSENDDAGDALTQNSIITDANIQTTTDENSIVTDANIQPIIEDNIENINIIEEYNDEYNNEYIWQSLDDNQLFTWITCGENDDYISAIMDDNGEEYSCLLTRIGELGEEDQAVIYDYIDSLQGIIPLMTLNNAPSNSGIIEKSFTENGLTLTVSYPSNIVLGENTRFNLSVSGGSGNYKYRMYSLIDGDGDLVVDVSKGENANFKTQDYYDFTFYESGTYYIRFTAMDMNQIKTVRSDLYGIRLDLYDENYPAVEVIADGIAAMCLQSCTTDYEKVLWLHDYLINNMAYDNSYTYCSAEGAFYRHSGTCEAYHRAYVMLLKKVGIETGRIEGNMHVWTAVKIDGSWYQVDTTWDDYPETYGFERHLHMCINDEITALVHDQHKPNAGYESNSLEYNWLIKSGKIKDWTNKYTAQIQNEIKSKKESFEIQISDYMPYGYRVVVYNVAAYAFEKEDWGKGVTLSSTYTDGGKYDNSGTLSFKVEYAQVNKCGDDAYWMLDGDGNLSITGSGEITSTTWLDSKEKIKTVSIENGISIIPNNAFSNCTNIKTVTFEGAAPQIGQNCFSGDTLTALYDSSYNGWTSSMMTNYGGSILWKDSNAIYIDVSNSGLSALQSVYVDGVEYTVDNSGKIKLTKDSDPKILTCYSYNKNAGDVHTIYPTDLNVYEVNGTKDNYTLKKIAGLDNCLQYKGSSIRIAGVKGIRMITGIPDSIKQSLVSGSLEGYTLEEYGTLLAWAKDISDTTPLVLGKSYVKSNYAYKKGVADPVFKQSGGLTQYTNVITFGKDLSKCVDDLAMRPYMILSKGGERVTIYGGILYRNIGYVAWQNANAFAKGNEAYNFIWDIINYVYPGGYKEAA